MYMHGVCHGVCHGVGMRSLMVWGDVKHVDGVRGVLGDEH